MHLYLKIFCILSIINHNFIKSITAMEPEPTKFSFELLTESNLPLLHNWFMQDYIFKLWPESRDFEIFKTKYLAKLKLDSTTFPFVAYYNRRPIAYIQYFRTDAYDQEQYPGVDIPVGSIGMDLFIGEPDCLGKGLGERLLRDFIDFVKLREPDCKLIIIDPAVDNKPAIKCYKKVGFKVIGEYITQAGPTGTGPGPILLLAYSY